MDDHELYEKHKLKEHEANCRVGNRLVVKKTIHLSDFDQIKEWVAHPGQKFDVMELKGRAWDLKSTDGSDPMWLSILNSVIPEYFSVDPEP